MDNLQKIVQLIAKGDTRAAELLFNKPGGRNYLESIVLIVVSNLACSGQEKADLFGAFIQTMDKIEKRIKRQKEGQKILDRVTL